LTYSTTTYRFLLFFDIPEDVIDSEGFGQHGPKQQGEANG